MGVIGSSSPHIACYEDELQVSFGSHCNPYQAIKMQDVEAADRGYGLN